MPASKDLTSDTLAMLSEGIFGRMIEEQLAKITHDLEQRGVDGKARKLNITVEFKFNESGRYEITPTCDAKLPPTRAWTTMAKMNFDPDKKQHVLEFNPDSLEPSQGTINDVNPRREE